MTDYSNRSSLVVEAVWKILVQDNQFSPKNAVHMIKPYVPRFCYFNTFFTWKGRHGVEESQDMREHMEAAIEDHVRIFKLPCVLREPKGGLDFCSDQQNPISSVSI